MRTTIQLPDDLLARAKKKAAAEGRTLTSLIEDGLRTVLAAKPAKSSASRILPRVSKATGGLASGIDPIKLNTTTQEIEDIERMARINRMSTKP